MVNRLHKNTNELTFILNKCLLTYNNISSHRKIIKLFYSIDININSLYLLVI